MIGRTNSFSRRLLAWYDRSRRDLPWRVSPGSPLHHRLDPYHVLVSEAMLQQTQVATVIPYFQRFLQKFPTVADLAAADEQDVLRAWQGLGYYSRARHLRAAAQVIVSQHGGRVPATVEALRALPGVGAYTAGAVASIAYNCRAPIVDGNVARVLCRIDRIETDPRDTTTLAILWRRAEEILPHARVGDFNSSLMELGAMVCTPRAPQCLVCPIRAHCEAVSAGVQDRIPAPRKTKATPLLHRDVLCVRSRRDGGAGDDVIWLIEQRPASGRWAGMWQFVTVARNGKPPTAKDVAKQTGLVVEKPKLIGAACHALTHRRYAFEIYVCTARADYDRYEPWQSRPRKWVTRAELERYPLPRPHAKIARMLDAL
ncbi:MAG TPA: A/G-specific adenine glycosylase [Tepidisphaeraceae bacterium]|nr:A/G-specific adenine glycosylase [Tepidisphaeraceae bacterium]